MLRAFESKVIFPETILFFFIFLLSGCKGPSAMIIGKVSTTEQRDDNGNLMREIKIRKRSTQPFPHPHNSVIQTKKVKSYQKGTLIEYTVEKRKITLDKWEGYILRYKSKKLKNK